ncbi:hypothetical protein [Paenibacillus dauci]|uniref:hypothetical protein n=1 Tax=Paenibacillus dauci TaxID=1567106 RepID=UPI0006191736|nr:hypothetical protein [Paenibacillus dauci]
MNDFYEKFKLEFSTHALIFDHMKILDSMLIWLLRLLFFSGIGSVISFVIFVVTNFFIEINFVTHKIFLVFFGIMAIVFLMVIVTTLALSKKAKVILNNNYGIKVVKGRWKNQEFITYQQNKIIKELKEKDFYSTEKIKILISILDKKINESNKGYFTWSLLTSLVLIVCSQFVAGIYRSIAISDWLHYFGITIMLVVICVAVAVIFSMSKFYRDIIKETTRTESFYGKELIECLEEILLAFKNEQAEKEIYKTYIPRRLRRK